MTSRRRSPGEGGLFQQKTGKKLWVGTVEVPTFDGKRRQRRVYAKTKSECAAKKRKLAAEVAAGVLPVSGNTTVAKWCETWLNETAKARVRPSTYRDYEQAIRSYIVPAIGPIRLDRLTAQHVRRMVSSVETSRGAQRAHQTLGMALKAAVRDGLIARNVVDAVDRPRHLPAQRTALSADVAIRLIEAAIDLDNDRSRPPMAARWMFGLVTGARRGEVLGLEWDRVDLERGTAELSWQLQQLSRPRLEGAPADFEWRECYRSLVLTRPKTKAGWRVVPLEWPLLPMMQSLYGPRLVDAGTVNPHDLVWHHRDGRPISPREDHDLWSELLKHAGIPHVPLHTLRHTAATLMQEDRVPSEIRMAIMGQSSYAAHMGYIHVDQSQGRAAVAALGRKLGGSLVIDST